MDIDKLMNDKAEMKRELLGVFWKKVDPQEPQVGEHSMIDNDSDDE